MKEAKGRCKMSYKYIWEDPAQFKINKEDGHTMAMPFDSADDALSGIPSKYKMSLRGDWDFFWQRGVENQLDGLFGTGGGADNHSLVVLQNAEPGLNIGGGVFEAGRRFKAQFMQAAGGADFRDKLLFAVRFGAESGGGSVPGETV